jgi:hypothetical protein
VHHNKKGKFSGRESKCIWNDLYPEGNVHDALLRTADKKVRELWGVWEVLWFGHFVF